MARPIRVEAGVSYRSLGVKWYAKGLFIKEPLNGSEIKATRLFLVEKDDFIYNRLFAWKGSFAVAGPEHVGCVVSGEFPIFRINPKRLSLMYLMAFFSSPWLWEMIAGHSSGTAEVSRLRLKEDAFLRLTIPLPPLGDQERIVKRLDEADELRKLRAQADQRTDVLIPALFHQMFGMAAVKKSGWAVKPLSEMVADMQQGFACRPSENGSETPQIRPLNMTILGTITLEGTKAVSCSLAKAKKYDLRAGDVLFNNTNSPALVGKSAVFREAGSFVFSNHMTRIRVHEDQVTPDYLHHFLFRAWSDGFFRHQCTQWINQAAIGIAALGKIVVPCPPLNLQKEFVRKVAEIRELEAAQSASRQRLDALSQSMLHRAFNGAL